MRGQSVRRGLVARRQSSGRAGERAADLANRARRAVRCWLRIKPRAQRHGQCVAARR